MDKLPRRKKLRVNARLARLLEPGGRSVQDLIVDGYAPAQMIQDLRKYQAELEIQNQALRYSQQEAEGASERFSTLFSNVPLALMVVDEVGLVLASNAMALRLFQPQESDPPLNFLLPFVGTEHTDVVAVAFLSAEAHGTAEVSEVNFRAGNAGSFTGDLHIARIENPQDELAHFICATIDQGPLLAQRQELQQSAAVLLQRNEDLLLSENRMAAIINSSLDAILCIDERHGITVFNPAATTLFQCPADQALGSPLSMFLPDVQRVLEAGNLPNPAVLGEYRAVTLRGDDIFVEISVALERRGATPGLPPDTKVQNRRRDTRRTQGAITTIFARDLTARKLAESQRFALENQLRESQKMQAIGTMAGGIAHDFNNILSAILGNVSLATQDVPPGSVALTSLQEIDKAGRRARDLVRQILTFSRNEPPKRIPIDLIEVIEETVHLVKVAMPPTVKLRVKLARDCPAVLADATQVQQALLNLCTNAFLAVGNSKGTVALDLNTEHLVSPDTERLGVAAGQYAVVTVRDTGSGMTAQTLLRIFEPFFTTRQVGQGTGLGLSVVHGIMQTHQGAVDAQSTVGSGSTFTLYFPTTQEKVQAALLPPQPSSESSGNGRTVMYVDDDQALVFLVKRVLTRKGYAVVTFTDPQMAHAALRANPKSVDLLVTDYNMPGYSGLDLLRKVKAIRPDLPVALASGYVTPELESRAMAEGADALIYKPNDVNELCDTVERLIQWPADHDHND